MSCFFLGTFWTLRGPALSFLGFFFLIGVSSTIGWSKKASVGDIIRVGFVKLSDNSRVDSNELGSIFTPSSALGILCLKLFNPILVKPYLSNILLVVATMFSIVTSLRCALL